MINYLFFKKTLFIDLLIFQVGVKDAFDTAIWEALVSLKMPRPKPLWRKLFCLA